MTGATDGPTAHWPDVLVAERAASSAFDPVTGLLSLRSLRASMSAVHRAAGVTVMTLAWPEHPPCGRPGRFGTRDVDDRLLSRLLLPWATSSGGTLAWVGDGVAALLTHESDDVQDQMRLRQLRRLLRQEAAPGPLVSCAQGPGSQAWDVLARSVAGLRGEHPGPAPLQRQRRLMRDVLTHETVGYELVPGPRHALGRDRSRLLTALSRAPAALERSEQVLRRFPDLVAHRPRVPVLYDATSLLCARLSSQVRVDALLDRLQVGVHLGVDAWALAQIPALVEQMADLRDRGRTVVLTGYGCGREPTTPLDELPVDAVCLDPDLEGGARTSRADRAVRWALVEHAAQHDVLVLSVLDDPPATGGIVPEQGSPAPVARTPRTQQLLTDTRAAGVTPGEAAILLNAARAKRSDERRWDRYRVALAWAAHARSLPPSEGTLWI